MDRQSFLEKYIFRVPSNVPTMCSFEILVRDEIIQTLKGISCSAIFPALSLHFSGTGLSQAFCGWGDYSLLYHTFTFFVVVLGSDFYEFSYHRLGHINFTFWNQVRLLTS